MPCIFGSSDGLPSTKKSSGHFATVDPLLKVADLGGEGWTSTLTIVFGRRNFVFFGGAVGASDDKTCDFCSRLRRSRFIISAVSLSSDFASENPFSLLGEGVSFPSGPRGKGN